MLPHLNERQRHVLAGAAAQMVGNKTAVAEAAGMSRNTVIKAEADVAAGMAPHARQRPPGAGRKAITEVQPGILEDLDRLVHPETRGDPMSLLRWTSKSTYKLAEELVRQGFKVSADSVGRLLKRLGYSLQAPSKQKEGTRHPDRDDQFRYLGKMAQEFLDRGQPAISVDTKKKELVGEFSNGGREWQPKGEPEEVNVHDFVDKELGRAVPYGIYDLANDEGWVSVGGSADTAEFAVNSIRAWWAGNGRRALPRRHPAPYNRRCRRVQRLPAQSLEDQPGQVGDRARLRGHGLPLPARDVQMEQDRAQDVQFHHHELARPAAPVLPHHCRAHLGDWDKELESTCRP